MRRSNYSLRSTFSRSNDSVRFRPLGNYPEMRASKKAHAPFPAFSKNDCGLDLSGDLVSDCC
jgi:hypothetical protein